MRTRERNRIQKIIDTIRTEHIRIGAYLYEIEEIIELDQQTQQGKTHKQPRSKKGMWK